MKNSGKFKIGHIPFHKGKTKKDFPKLCGNRKIGRVPWNKGLKMSQEQKEKISKSKIGVCASRETRKKLSLIRMGDGNPNWKGGKTPVILQARTCKKYLRWRLSVYERDLFTCRECNYHGKDMEAHHIIPFSTFFHDNDINTLDKALKFDDLWNINNGITLCKNCHKSKTIFYGNQYMATPTTTRG